MYENSLSYLTRKIRDFGILDKNELSKLICQYQNGDIEAGKQIVLHNIKWVIQIAIGFVRKNGVEFDDIISHGILGMYRAMDKYDSSLGAFSTYSRHWIMQSIIRNHILKQDLINSKEYKKVDRYRFVTINDPEKLPDHNSIISIEANHEDHYIKKNIIEYINNIKDKRTQSIMMHRFNFVSEHRELSLRDIGKMHGLSAERIRQIIDAQIRKMKRNKKLRSLVGKKF